MINIKSEKCIFENCEKQPSFNYKNISKAIYCVNHKLEEMIDVRNKKCFF